MEILKIELPRTLEPEFYCPFTGHNLVGEGLQDALDDGYLYLAVNWADADEYVMGEEDIVQKYKKFQGEEGEDSTDRIARFLESENLSNKSFIIELTVNAMACGPISDTNTFVFYK
jgi:hypothetical protein